MQLLVKGEYLTAPQRGRTSQQVLSGISEWLSRTFRQPSIRSLSTQRRAYSSGTVHELCVDDRLVQALKGARKGRAMMRVQKTFQVSREQVERVLVRWLCDVPTEPKDIRAYATKIMRLRGLIGEIESSSEA